MPIHSLLPSLPLAGLKTLGLWDSTDLIIVSDHGMASNSCPAHFLYWDQVFPTALATYNDLLQANELNSPLIGIRPEEGKESEVYNAMKKDLEEAEEKHIQVEPKRKGATILRGSDSFSFSQPPLS